MEKEIATAKKQKNIESTHKTLNTYVHDLIKQRRTIRISETKIFWIRTCWNQLYFDTIITLAEKRRFYLT
jgi:hypothetical protein